MFGISADVQDTPKPASSIFLTWRTKKNNFQIQYAFRPVIRTGRERSQFTERNENIISGS